MKPEELARQQIDEMLSMAGWVVQDRQALNLGAGPGVAIREFSLRTGTADYLLMVNREVVGVVEAKPAGHSLIGVREQSAKYLSGIDATLPVARTPLPFHYETTGQETRFTSNLDPVPRSRLVFSFHRPEMLQQWLELAPEGGENATLRARLLQMPPLATHGLRDCQIEAITNLERSFTKNHPRALIQMATGSGKTFTAVNFIYRLIKFGGARRVLFLVDRDNLGKQTYNEFQQFMTPDDGRKFTELYNVQHLRGKTIDNVARVCITNIQRLYSILSGEEEPDEAAEERSLFESEEEDAQLLKEPKHVYYNPAVPIETFDVIVTDECHRSIYNLWRGVLEYFDAFIVGLTATPNKQTFGFFNQNLVMEYGHERAVADGVNVDYLVYTIRTQITAQGSTIEKGYYIDKRDRRTRKLRWEQASDDIIYSGHQLDRDVVAKDQIRTVLRTFRDVVCTEIFPGRSAVPKTLIFAKDDSHADDIVEILLQEFGQGNEFAQKITYKTTGRKPEELISQFRNSYNPRIAVTVDMISTGTDIKPLEILLFMRAVKSANFFEQMKGRGTRVIDDEEFKRVTPDVPGGKTHFVLVDAVGVYESAKTDEPPLEREPTVPLKKVLDDVAVGRWRRNPDLLSTLLSRLSRLNRRLQKPGMEQAAQTIRELSGGKDLRGMIQDLNRALDPDTRLQEAQAATGEEEPGAVALQEAARRLAERALLPFDEPGLRAYLLTLQARDEQIIDTVSQDRLQEAGWDVQAREAARQTVTNFRQFLETHKDEITALQIFYSQGFFGTSHDQSGSYGASGSSVDQNSVGTRFSASDLSPTRPHSKKMTEDDLRQLAEAIKAPPLGLTEDKLWQAYETLDANRVRKSTSVKRRLTDLVSLLRYTMSYETDETAILEPYEEIINQRFAEWLDEQEQRRGAPFSAEQRRWLEHMRDIIANSLTIERDDFSLEPLLQLGGLGKATELFGPDLPNILQELNERLAA
ncbi:MAG TPA: DEAD/DEAH box helicase family protein [Ktedonosporobacter sp.]|jgi:type I restriction enzyme R subunit|nr:DEAD/DEAH box helicase family protein [Ktedonosporobacter sp.]